MGDEVELPDLSLKVERLDGRRIDRVRLTDHAAHNDGEDQQSVDGGQASQ